MTPSCEEEWSQLLPKGNNQWLVSTSRYQGSNKLHQLLTTWLIECQPRLTRGSVWNFHQASVCVLFHPTEILRGFRTTVDAKKSHLMWLDQCNITWSCSGSYWEYQTDCCDRRHPATKGTKKQWSGLSLEYFFLLPHHTLPAGIGHV